MGVPNNADDHAVTIAGVHRPLPPKTRADDGTDLHGWLRLIALIAVVTITIFVFI